MSDFWWQVQQEEERRKQDFSKRSWLSGMVTTTRYTTRGTTR